jgi:hypothetical protein
MKLDELQAYARRKPFRAFTVNLLDGEAIYIDSPEAILLHPRKPELVIAFTSDKAMHLFEHAVIASLVEGNTTP